MRAAAGVQQACSSRRAAGVQQQASSSWRAAAGVLQQAAAGVQQQACSVITQLQAAAGQWHCSYRSAIGQLYRAVAQLEITFAQL